MIQYDTIIYFLSLKIICLLSLKIPKKHSKNIKIDDVLCNV